MTTEQAWQAYIEAQKGYAAALRVYEEAQQVRLDAWRAFVTAQKADAERSRDKALEQAR